MGQDSHTLSAQKRASPATSAAGLPTTTNGKLRPLRGRQMNKTFNNIKITLLCGFVTIIVLRGTIGIGTLSSPATDPASHLIREETNRILEEIRSDREPDEPDDPGPSNATYSLGPKITNWDEQRKQWLQVNPSFPNTVRGRPRVMLLSGSPPNPCSNPIGDHYLLKSLKNKIDYCRLHGIEIVYNMAHLDKEMAGYWAKLPMIRRLMIFHPEVEWIWWMDSDAMFTDITFEVPLDRYADHNFVIHGYSDLLEKHNWVALNTGSFLIRNSQWGLDLLDAWAPMGPRGRVREEAGKVLTKFLIQRPDFEADDQSALIYLLSQSENWMGKVYVENKYYLHGYWPGLVDRYEEVIEKYRPGYGDDRWPFITHFVGCKPCGKYGDYPVDRCLKSMEKAFNFADNQVLKFYGFGHKGLFTPKLKRIVNETDAPLEYVDRVDIRRLPVSETS